YTLIELVIVIIILGILA
nr:pilin {N-terminal} [Aeromonas sobria, TAP13, Peptide Partial, 17 aa] [Aeromonas sobria]